MKYRCTSCGRNGIDQAFWHIFPPTPEEVADAVARGVTLPDSPLYLKPIVMCPQCKATDTVVDDDGNHLQARRFPTMTKAEEDAHRAVTRALRAGMAGRRPHGTSMEEAL